MSLHKYDRLVCKSTAGALRQVHAPITEDGMTYIGHLETEKGPHAMRHASPTDVSKARIDLTGHPCSTRYYTSCFLLRWQPAHTLRMTGEGQRLMIERDEVQLLWGGAHVNSFRLPSKTRREHPQITARLALLPTIITNKKQLHRTIIAFVVACTTRSCCPSYPLSTRVFSSAHGSARMTKCSASSRLQYRTRPQNPLKSRVSVSVFEPWCSVQYPSATRFLCAHRSDVLSGLLALPRARRAASVSGNIGHMGCYK